MVIIQRRLSFPTSPLLDSLFKRYATEIITFQRNKTKTIYLSKAKMVLVHLNLNILATFGLLNKLTWINKIRLKSQAHIELCTTHKIII